MQRLDAALAETDNASHGRRAGRGLQIQLPHEQDDMRAHVIHSSRGPPPPPPPPPSMPVARPPGLAAPAGAKESHSQEREMQMRALAHAAAITEKTHGSTGQNGEDQVARIGRMQSALKLLSQYKESQVSIDPNAHAEALREDKFPPAPPTPKLVAIAPRPAPADLSTR